MKSPVFNQKFKNWPFFSRHKNALFFFAGSAISLGSGCDAQALTASDTVGHVRSSVRRCDSDIDIISNPSQSSIEILEDSNR